MGTKSRQKKVHIYQTNTVTKDIEDHYTVIKGSSQQEKSQQIKNIMEINYLFERKIYRARERQKKIFYLLVLFPNVCNSQS